MSTYVLYFAHTSYNLYQLLDFHFSLRLTLFGEPTFRKFIRDDCLHNLLWLELSSERLIKQSNVNVQNQGTVEPPWKLSVRHSKQWGWEKVNQKAPPLMKWPQVKLWRSSICFLCSGLQSTDHPEPIWGLWRWQGRRYIRPPSSG